MQEMTLLRGTGLPQGDDAGDGDPGSLPRSDGHCLLLGARALVLPSADQLAVGADDRAVTYLHDGGRAARYVIGPGRQPDREGSGSTHPDLDGLAWSGTEQHRSRNRPLTGLLPVRADRAAFEQESPGDHPPGVCPEATVTVCWW